MKASRLPAFLLILVLWALPGLADNATDKPVSTTVATTVTTTVPTAIPAVPTSNDSARPLVETPKAPVKAAPPAPLTEQENATLQTLSSIRESLDDLRSELTAKRQALSRARSEDQKVALAAEITTLNDRIASLERSFESISTGADLDSFTAKRVEKFDWTSELQAILGPILQELKGLTERPREIERLRNQVEYYQARVPAIQAAQAKVDRMAEVTRDRAVLKLLDSVRKTWESREQQASGELSVVQYQLAEKLKDRTSVLESVQNMARSFFQSRGRNLILSILAFVSVFVILNFSLRAVHRVSPLHTVGKASFLSRLFDILYHGLTVIGATTAGLAVLYIAGDWLLLGLALIFLFGAAWAAKQSLSKFWDQCKLLLDLGTVREGERIIYNGLPFKVAALNVYSSLVNPNLRGGRVRLPLQTLVGMNSRPFDPEELWFPSREGDWVLLPDNVYGRVVLQTPEVVQVVLPGGSRRSFPAARFLEMSPINLSTGFRARTVIGLDYSLQEKCLVEIPKILQAYVREGLEREGFKAQVHDVSASLMQAGASSLDMLVVADFDGAAASKYLALSGLMHRFCVEACTKNGWNIPFQQIVVRQAGQ